MDIQREKEFVSQYHYDARTKHDFFDCDLELHDRF